MTVMLRPAPAEQGLNARFDYHSRLDPVQRFPINFLPPDGPGVLYYAPGKYFFSEAV